MLKVKWRRRAHTVAADMQEHFSDSKCDGDLPGPDHLMFRCQLTQPVGHRHVRPSAFVHLLP